MYPFLILQKTLILAEARKILLQLGYDGPRSPELSCCVYKMKQEPVLYRWKAVTQYNITVRGILFLKLIQPYFLLFIPCRYICIEHYNCPPATIQHLLYTFIK